MESSALCKDIVLSLIKLKMEHAKNFYLMRSRMNTLVTNEPSIAEIQKKLRTNKKITKIIGFKYK